MANSKQLRGIRQNVRFQSLTQNVGGLIKNRADRFLPPSAAVTIENMHATSEGSWTARNVGYENMNGTAYQSGATMTGLIWFTDSSLVDHLLATANGKLIEINTSTFAETVKDASAGVSTSSITDMVQYGNKVYMVDGTIATPRTWDGTTAANSGGWPVNALYDTPKLVEVHNGRLAYANFDTYPSHIALSDVTDGETFTIPAVAASDAAVIEVSPGDGQTITGMKSVFVPQTNDTFLVITKQRSTYVMTGQSALPDDPDPFTVILANANYGCVNNQSIVQVGNDILMLGELPGGGFGILSYSTAMQNGTLQPSLIGSDVIRPILSTINRNAVDKSYAVHFPSRREVVFGIPVGASSTVNRWLVYKYSAAQDDTPKWSIRTGIVHPCGLVYKDTIYFGTTNGYLSEWFKTSTANGTGIAFTYEYPYMVIGTEGQYKRVTTAWAHFKTPVNINVSITSEWLGGGNNNIKTVSVPLGSSVTESLYGTAVYGTGYYGEVVERKRQFKVFGNGERLKVKIQGTTTSNGGPEFLGVTAHVEYGGTSHHYN